MLTDSKVPYERIGRLEPVWREGRMSARHILQANVDHDDHQHGSHRRPPGMVRLDGLY